MQATKTIDTYTTALGRARRDGCEIIADHMEAGRHVAYVWSPRSSAVYVVTIWRDHMACECKAYGYCKHRALVRSAEIAKMTLAAKATYTAALTQPARPASSTPAPIVRGLNDPSSARRPFSIFK